MGEEELFQTIAGSAPALFPVSSLQAPSSSSVTPRLFPSFASAPSPVFPIVQNARPEHEAAVGHGSEERNEFFKSAPGAAVQDDPSKDVRKRRKEKKRKRRKEEGRIEKREKEPKIDTDVRTIGALDDGVERKSAGTGWADRNANLRKPYYFDTRGDRDNLAFGSLYRKDVATYSREEMRLAEVPGGIFALRHTLLEFETDGVLQDESVKAGGRYWSMKFTSLVRRRRLKQLRIGNDKAKRSLSDPELLAQHLGSFVPLEIGGEFKEEAHDNNPRAENREEGETWQEYVALKTEEFNRLTRERPHEESSWVRFADFQDEIMQATTKKYVVQQLVEKKIAILERALNSHKGSEDLLILYLETCKRRDDAGTLLSKWEHAVRCHPGSFRMWQEFLRFRCAQFSTFSIASIRTLYNNALHALSAARNRMRAIGIGEDAEDFVDAEQGLVCMFVNLCRFNWQAGHHELAVGLFQAEIEYSLFGPQIELGETDKLRAFEDFWRSGAHRFGEDGASGWVSWLEESQEQQQQQEAREIKLAMEAQLEEQAGGWTGWTTPSKELADFNGEPELVDDEPLSADEDAEVDHNSSQMEEDDAALQEMLGLNFDSSKDLEVKDTTTWKRWSEKEVQRGREQWLPLHSQFGVEEDQLERMVLFEDINDSLFTLHTKQAQLSLVYQFIDFCDGPISEWCCSNKESYISKMGSLESLKGAMLADIKCANPVEVITENPLLRLMKFPSWHHESDGRAKFLRNCVGLVRSVFPHDRLLLDALLNAEDLASEDNRSRSSNMAPSQALCKKLLKIHRNDLLIWTAYACIEAVAGNVVVARKVFDTALASLGALSMDVVRDVPVLCLAYAEVELARVSGEPDASAKQRALHILCSLGIGSTYVPVSGSDPLPTTLLLKGHLGFREQLHKIRKSEGRNLTERGAAFIACAALFEYLVSGWESASVIFEEGLAMCLPGKRQQSLECELLTLRRVHMLEKSEKAAKPALLWSTMLGELRQYPCNAKLIGGYVRSASQSACSHKLRRFFDYSSQRYASPALWIFALVFEMWRPGAGPRIHRLFERAMESKETKHSVLLWRCYLAYEVQIAANLDAARRVYFRAIHACPWSKTLWVDGFLMLSSILSAKELSEFVDVMRDKGLRIRTDVYEILLEDEDDGLI